MSGVPVVATDSVVPVRLEESNQEQGYIYIYFVIKSHVPETFRAFTSK